MAKTRGAHAASPSTRNPRPRASLMRDFTSEAPYAGTRRVDHPLHLGQALRAPRNHFVALMQKKARVSGPGESSTPPQPQLPTIESQIPSRMTPEVGNLDCRARPFHSELCFDMETFRQQSELRDSFHLL
ncbi:hypothetical protein AAG906_008182 [Vitis piasezkii]